MPKTKSKPKGRKKQPPGKRPHRFRSYLNEIRPTWKKNPDMVVPMMEDMIEKKARFLFDKVIILEFIQQFMTIHQISIKKIRPEKFETVYSWIFMYRLQTNADIYNWFRKQKYEHKFWLNDQLHLDYLNKEIKDRSEKLFEDHPEDPNRSRHYDILMKFKEGEFPDLDTYTMIEVGTAIADIEFIEFLQSERDKLQGATTKTTIKVPVELKVADSREEHQIVAQIPKSFFEQLGRGQTMESQETTYASDKKVFPEPKLYTREQTAKLMQVSVSTIDNLTKGGTLICHRIHGTNMKRYKWEDIDNALHAIEMRVNKRFR